MFSGKADDRLRVQIPSAADDQPSWTKVSVIAAAGFLIGVIWPHIAGVKLGPSLPADAPNAIAAAGAGSAIAPGPSAAPGGASPSVPAAANVPAPSAPPASAAAASVSVGHGAVFACRSTDGATLKGPDCGALPGLDALVTPRLHKLAECPDAASASGKLHLVAHPDFAHGALSIDLGKGPNAAPSDALLTCARSALAGATVTGLTHEHPRYSVSYVVTFAAPSAAAPTEPASPDEPRTTATTDDGDSSAQVVWEVAIVRDAPKIGKVVARLQRGASVHLGAAKDGWYPVKFGDGFASDGWLYRGAIGK